MEQSETLIVLGTKLIFTRPICLLEIWWATRHDIPVVILDLMGRGFDAVDAMDVLENLELRLRERNPEAFQAVCSSHMGVVCVGRARLAEPPPPHPTPFRRS